MKKISILIPAYNEEGSLKHLFPRLNNLARDNDKYEFEFLFVNDGSSDRTLEIIKEQAKKDSRIFYVSLSRRFHKELGMVAGFDHVTGDATVVVDADLQDPPELIKEMIKYWEQGYDDVYAKRRSREGETWLKKKTAELYYSIVQKSTPLFEIQQNTGDFRLLDKRCVQAIRQIRESQRQAKAIFSWIGYKKKEILYDRDPRIAGKTKWNYPYLINLAISGITSFSTTPLRISSVLGFIVSLIAFVFIIVVIAKTILLGDPVGGYPSLMAVILFLGGIQLLSLGIIGEYIGRIFNETKNRPLYLIQETNVNKNTKTQR